MKGRQFEKLRFSTGNCTKMVNRTFSFKSKKESKDKESIQSSTTPDQDTNEKVTTSQLDITNESQEVSPFPAGGHKASTNKCA